MSSPVSLPPTPVVKTARAAVFTAFALNGAAFAAFASRVPDLKFQLGLSAGELGLTLLAASLGAVIGLPVSGWFVGRFGAARTMVGAAMIQAVGFVGVGIGIDVVQDRAVVAVALFLVGAGNGTFDVAMNFEGATVERLLGRAIMPHFHAAFSGGTVVSALIGAGLSFLHVSIVVHLVSLVVLMALVLPWLPRAFLPRTVETDDEPASERSGMRAAWLEPRTLLIGVVVLAAAFTEGTANDWVAVALSDGYQLPRWAGVLGFAVGCLLVVFGGQWIAFVGAAVWGVGASLGFPVGMSAAADEPRRAAARLSVVSTIGYTAFLAGPPLLGFLGDHVGVLHSLLVVGAMAVIALLAIPAVREPARVD